MAGEPTFSPSVNPSYPFKEDFQPKVLATEYGDGYIERAGDGLNQANHKDLNLEWENLTLVERNEIRTFLLARKGYEAFLWTAPDGSQEKFICPNWGSEKTDADNWNVSATFKRVFDN